MFTIKLIEKNNDYLIYDIWDGDQNEYVNQIKVNKHDFSYNLKNGKEFTNQYETGSYRAIKEAIQSNSAPQQFSNGWG